eukprot:TRINITY_DN3034_c0_g8_i2.p2 TRINITY_DN3034_c0_g8~~TRINITY_DN3034_c0_g8_i2.p2  ORF type:complete len:108 (-),score=42.67 TRINITY_DN3034_c0_g8_i2:77-400(-)
MYRLSMSGEDVKAEVDKSEFATICQLYTNRSLCYFTLGNYEKAAEDADAVIEGIDPNNAKARFRKGMALEKLGLRDKAITELKLAVKIEPENELFNKELAALTKKKR